MTLNRLREIASKGISVTVIPESGEVFAVQTKTADVSRDSDEVREMIREVVESTDQIVRAFAKNPEAIMEATYVASDIELARLIEDLMSDAEIERRERASKRLMWTPEKKSSTRVKAVTEERYKPTREELHLIPGQESPSEVKLRKAIESLNNLEKIGDRLQREFHLWEFDPSPFIKWVMRKKPDGTGTLHHFYGDQCDCQHRLYNSTCIHEQGRDMELERRKNG